MNRIIALLAALSLSACQSDRKPSIASGPTLIQGFDADGRATLTSYAGRTSAGAGMLNDTTEAGTISDLAKHIGPGIELGYAHIVKSDVVQPNVETVEKLENDHKDALSLVAKAAAAGATKDLDAAQEVAKIAGKKLLDKINAGKGGPQPDSGANSARVLILGKNAGQHTVEAVGKYSDAYKAKQARADYGSTIDTATTDTTTAADINALADAIKEARLATEAARLAGKTNTPPAEPVAPPIVFPPLDPAPVVTPPASTNATETIVLPELPK